MPIDLPFIWAGIIAFAVLAYVILDGFDLGVGILFPFFPEKHEKDLMMNSVAPVWDGNETWLVLGGEGLLAAFPVAYSIILSGLYLPLIFIFRQAADTHVAEAKSTLSALIYDVTQNVKPGSENAVEIIKTAIDNAFKGYEQVTQATRQAVETVEAQIAKAASMVQPGAQKQAE